MIFVCLLGHLTGTTATTTATAPCELVGYMGWGPCTCNLAVGCCYRCLYTWAINILLKTWHNTLLAVPRSSGTGSLLVLWFCVLVEEGSYFDSQLLWVRNNRHLVGVTLSRVEAKIESRAYG